MKVRVLFFASLAERAGRREETIELPEGSTAGALWSRLCQDRPGLSGAAPPAVARNGRYAPSGERLTEGDEVALLPPVSGG